MPLQSAKNVRVAFKTEATFNTPPGATGAEYLRFTPSAGLTQKAATIRSNEQRADALQTMGRNGSRMVDGGYTCEMSVRSHDTIYEAVVRGTWEPALVIDQATTGGPTSIDTVADGIVGNGGGSWITAGIRRGDVLRMTGHSVSSNNGKNLRVRAVTATKITTHETLVAEATDDTTFTITRGKKLKNPLSPTKRTVYVEQENVDIDGSQQFGGTRWVGMKINGTPDGMATVEFTALGAQMRTATGASSPYFTDPTAHNSDPLVFADARINVSGSDIAVATAFELTYAITAATEPVVGSVVSPDVFDNDAELTGSFSMIRQDFLNVVNFVDEVEFELHVLLTEPESEPKDYFAIYVPRCKYTDATAPLGGDGAMIETLPFQTGAQAAVPAEGREATLLVLCTSAAA